MSLVNDLIGILGGTIGSLPIIEVLVISFLVGLIIGVLIKTILKIGIILAIAALIAVYFGIISLATISTTLRDLTDKYGPIALQYVAMFFGVLPLSLGFAIGIILGFVFG